MTEEEATNLLSPASDVESDESEPLMNLVQPRGYLTRHIFALMGFLGFANVYAMRVNLSVAIVAMVNNTAISNTSIVNSSDSCPMVGNTTDIPTDGPFDWGAREQGWLLGAFFYGYVLTQIPGGRLAEVYGGKRLYGLGVLITAIFTILTPLAANTSIYTLVLVRVVEGLGEGVTFPAMHAMLAVWVPPQERSRMAGVVYSGAQAGTVLSLPLSGYLCDRLGWESVFYMFGTLGVVWWVVWCYWVYDTPATHPTIHPAERRFIMDSLGSSRTRVSPPVPWLAIVTSGPVWALLITHVAQNFGFYTLLTELPTYMARVLHFNIRDNSIISALPYLLMLIIGLVSTRLADWVLSLGTDRTFVRKMFNSCAIYLPAVFLVLAGYSGCNSTLTIALLCLAVGTNGAHYAGFMCVHIDMASNYAGTLLGITNGAANIMGFVAPTVTGYIVAGHSDVPHWRLVFFIAAISYCVGNTIFLVFGTAREQKWNKSQGVVEEMEEDEDLLDRNEY
eukprot:TRINITY_DN7059_c0_g1_i1.p1 TRINITY_DN7059_c0_g1~~TRINITY_DN7059_c0_g1_i1.p1  ORF type:complete len:505 (-),score=159.42 TRINITY_DN7059_c0_g1_i1:141-1655(-)